MEESDILKFRIKVQETNGGDIWYYPQVYLSFEEEKKLPEFIKLLFIGIPMPKKTVWKWWSLTKFSNDNMWFTDEPDYRYAYFSSEKEEALAAIEDYKEYYNKCQNKLKEIQQKEFNNKIKSESYIEL